MGGVYVSSNFQFFFFEPGFICFSVCCIFTELINKIISP